MQSFTLLQQSTNIWIVLERISPLLSALNVNHNYWSELYIKGKYYVLTCPIFSSVFAHMYSVE